MYMNMLPGSLRNSQPESDVRNMKKMLKNVLILLPYIVMLCVLVTAVKGLFYDFHNDTVPMISMMISVFLSMLFLVLTAGTGTCILLYIRTEACRKQLLLAGIAVLLNLAFSALCLLCYDGQFNRIAVYFLLSVLLTAGSAALCRT